MDKHQYKTSLQSKYTLGAFVQLKSDPETMEFFSTDEELMDEIRYIIKIADLNEWEDRVSTGKYFYIVSIEPKTQLLQFAILDLGGLLKLQNKAGTRVLH